MGSTPFGEHSFWGAFILKFLWGQFLFLGLSGTTGETWDNMEDTPLEELGGRSNLFTV